MPEISVIIPTFQRAELVCRNVQALARQNIEASRFEVIVVSDGSTDRTVELLGALSVPFQLRVVEQELLGAAAARNAGAEIARGSLLVFLDDDMDPDPGLLDAHWQHQQAEPSLLVGFFTTPPSLRSDDPFTASSNTWWDNRFRQLNKPGHRPSFRDVCSGQMSMFREAFLDLGGFDTAIGKWAGEDYELGIRWLARRGQVCYCRKARTNHLDRPTPKKALRRAYNEGRGHVVIARRHPESFMSLPLRIGFDGQPWIHIRRWWRMTPSRVRLIKRLASPFLGVAAILKLRRLFGKLFGLARSASYWEGVFDEVGGLSGLREMIQNVPYNSINVDMIEIDIGQAPDDIAEIIAKMQPRSVGLRAGADPIEWIENRPGTAPICYEQLVAVIMRRVDATRFRELPPLETADASASPSGKAQ